MLSISWFVASMGCADLLDIPSSRHLEVDAAASSSIVNECEVSTDCTPRGEHYVCRGPAKERSCVSLLSAQCTVVEGDYRNPHAVFIGMMGPTRGPSASAGISIENSVRLAAAELHDTMNGLPPVPGSVERRPVVLVGCDDSEDELAAARHLVDVVGVPAIIGSAFSSVSIRVASAVTIKAGVLLISPSATSISFGDQPDQGLLWRTVPSDRLQSMALAKLFPLLEADVRTSLALPADAPLRVAVVHKGDTYGAGLAEAIGKRLTFNDRPAFDEGNEPFYLQINYGDAEGDDASSKVTSAVVDRLLTFKPHVVFALGFVEAVQGAVLATEARWPAELPRPRWLLADGALLPELKSGVGSDEALRRRILGTVPASGGPLFNQFRRHYSAVYSDPSVSSPETFGAAAGYDAFYVVAYAMAALTSSQSPSPNASPSAPSNSSPSAPLTGAAIASAIGRLVPPGRPIDVGPEAIAEAFTALGRGEQLDLSGASSSLDFDLEVGEVRSTIQIWCLPADVTVQTTALPSGLALDLEGNLTGSIQPQVCGFQLGG